MKVDVLLGLQWGDEGKGKIVDVFSPKYDVIARFQGGPNAGHTLEFDGIKHVLHTIPSGIFCKGVNNVIGNGVVIDPIILLKEIRALEEMGVDVNTQMCISRKAHLILPTHRLMDAAYEKAKGANKIGSTLRGIGPVYKDKIGRNGLRVGDIELSNFKTKYQGLVSQHETILNYYDQSIDVAEMEKEWFEAIEVIKEMKLVDSSYVMNEALNKNQSILAEGAQGTLLDIDFGSYPFVTSSNTVTAGACTGLGVAPTKIGEVYGIFKAYCTRVGSGPFPSELLGDTGEELRKAGHEFGATTGRPRRCGWLDLPALRYAVMINGVTQLIMTKADVLSGFEEIKVCTSYILPDGSQTSDLPYDAVFDLIKPVYKTLPGWKKDITTTKDIDELPETLMEYVSYIENEVGVPITIVSVGPDRTQTLIRSDIKETC